MTNQPNQPSSPPQDSATPGQRNPTVNTAVVQAIKPQPISQGKPGFRKNWPVWAKQLPRLSWPKLDESFQLIDRERLNELMQSFDQQTQKLIQDDLAHLDVEVLRLFRQLDYEASLQQNRYRLFQLGYISLAAIATLAGSLQALALSQNPPKLVPILAFAETMVALIATYLATISGRESPLPIWLTKRRRAEGLRREYYRYLLNLPPYDLLEGYHRRTKLSERAADINRGVLTDEKEEQPLNTQGGSTNVATGS